MVTRQLGLDQELVTGTRLDAKDDAALLAAGRRTRTNPSQELALVYHTMSPQLDEPHTSS